VNFAIIAAGEGSRLAQEGIKQPKPLVLIEGRTLIQRLMDTFMNCGATQITVIINQLSPATKVYLENLAEHYPLQLIVKTTAGSMESLYELIPYLNKEQKCCITTVDTIFKETEFQYFIDYFKDAEADSCMAVTDFIDDEKPLYIAANEEMQITGYYDTFNDSCNYISGGIYGLTPKCFKVLKQCQAKGMTRMRQFQKALVEAEMELTAYPFSKILDVDHASDIVKAEEFVKEPFPIIGIERGKEFSPNRADADQAIFSAVKENLEKMGHPVLSFTEDRFLNQSLYAPIVFSMGRREDTLLLLKYIEEEGGKVINSSDSIRNANRTHMTLLLKASKTPMPQSYLLETDQPFAKQEEKIHFPCWLKRGMGYSQEILDVIYLTNPAEAEAALAQFAKRNIQTAVACEHIEGDLIKFYGVSTPAQSGKKSELRFFHWLYPTTLVDSEGTVKGSKFGLEALNVPTKGFSFKEKELQSICHHAAHALNLQVYGGDAIISPDGSIQIIDFNDWPSFSPCLSEASEAIAKLISEQADEALKELQEESTLKEISIL